MFGIWRSRVSSYGESPLIISYSRNNWCSDIDFIASLISIIAWPHSIWKIIAVSHTSILSIVPINDPDSLNNEFEFVKRYSWSAVFHNDITSKRSNSPWLFSKL